ncbi:hypothetical protein ZIOFF_047459 [Zingiber officinale]|uniref:Uncharacterized protein n=1 Tax=Zingiber officinale TaxID=94328 RepID=A0A8J5KK61_ZINOF|nr:hypothetical protein ZIOFF_047459 [Zingiber officinale]
MIWDYFHQITALPPWPLPLASIAAKGIHLLNHMFQKEMSRWRGGGAGEKEAIKMVESRCDEEEAVKMVESRGREEEMARPKVEATKRAVRKEAAKRLVRREAAKREAVKRAVRREAAKKAAKSRVLERDRKKQGVNNT